MSEEKNTPPPPVFPPAPSDGDLLRALRKLFSAKPPDFTEEDRELCPKLYSWQNVRVPGLWALLADVEALVPDEGEAK